MIAWNPPPGVEVGCGVRARAAVEAISLTAAARPVVAVGAARHVTPAGTAQRAVSVLTEEEVRPAGAHCD